MNTAFNNEFFRGSGRGHVPRQLVEAVRAVMEQDLTDCATLDGIALYRAQGAYGRMREFLDALENGTPAPAPDAGISGI